MTDAGTPSTRTLHLYCQVEVAVTDPGALAEHAVAELRRADIDWAREEDDVESAAAELRRDVARSLASLVDVSALVEGVPGVEFRGGLCRAEPGPPRAPHAEAER
ncbi:hypothetical protein [Micromonospora sp. NPDC048830]|uniref:hypothetical protein n=1 Tax=Micromonospora sp. NPDC048830 TaxID=3364257 RepID=UPI0037139D9F